MTYKCPCVVEHCSNATDPSKYQQIKSPDLGIWFDFAISFLGNFPFLPFHGEFQNGNPTGRLFYVISWCVSKALLHVPCPCQLQSLPALDHCWTAGSVQSHQGFSQGIIEANLKFWLQPMVITSYLCHLPETPA